MGTHYARASQQDCQLLCQSETEFSHLQSFTENLLTTAKQVILLKSNSVSIENFTLAFQFQVLMEFSQHTEGKF